jgi:hypothetical protein
MQRRRIPGAISPQIYPEYRIARHWPKRNTFLPGLIAVHKGTPSFIARRIQEREVCAAARDVRRCNVYEEGTEPVAAHGSGRLRSGGEPVCVVVVSLTASVLHKLEGLEVRTGHIEALEGEGARLYTADGVVAE